MTQSQSESQSRQDGAFQLTSSPSATGLSGRYCMESNSKPWRLPVGTDLQIATRQDDKTANPRWKTAALSSLHNRRPSLVNDESSIQTVQNTSKNMQKEERRGYSCEKRLRLSVCPRQPPQHLSSPSPRGRPKSHGKVCRPWSRRNLINPTRREKCRSEVQSGSWRLQQAPRSKRRLTLGTLPCQIVSNHAAKLPGCRPLLLAARYGEARIQSPSGSLGVMAVLFLALDGESPFRLQPRYVEQDQTARAREDLPPNSIKAAEGDERRHVMQAGARGLSHAAAVHHHRGVSDCFGKHLESDIHHAIHLGRAWKYQ